MDMVELGMLCLCFIVGLGVGALFYLGLWWTVVRHCSPGSRALWLWMSFIVRIAAVAAIFYLIAGDHVTRYILTLLGFMLSRKIVVKMKTTG